MRKILIHLIIITMTVGVSGCSDFLDTTIYGVTVSDNFYKTEKEIEDALTECYYQTKQTYDNNVSVGDISTDDALKGGSSDSDGPELLDLQNFVVSADNRYAQDRWEQYYSIINRCNIVIEKAQSLSNDSELLKQYINEAKFLRAWSHYSLVSTFGDVPIVTETLSDGDYYIRRSPQNEVFEQIVLDLNDATALPKRSEYDSSNQGRITSGAAWALMGKVFLYQEKYLEAVNALRNIINSDEYKLHKEFYSNFEYKDRNGVESIFEIQYKSGGGKRTGFQLTKWISRIHEGGWGFHLPTQDLWNEFEPDDPRITYTFILSGDRFIGDNYFQDNSMSPSGYHNRKVFVPNSERGSDTHDVSHNVVILRYADVLLMYAEALNEIGESAEALIYLNKVRKRARNSSPLDPKRDVQVYVPATNSSTSLPDITTTNKEELKKTIWNERRCELAMEGLRRDDLVRQKRFGEVMRKYAQKYNSNKGRNFDDNKDYLLPIPSKEVNMSQETLRQNPGY